MRKQVAIYDPYLDTLGGGERYCLTVAEILLKQGYQVDLFWSGQKDLIDKAEKRFNLKLKGLEMVPDIFGVKPKKLELIEESHIHRFIKKTINPHRVKFKFKNLLQRAKSTSKYKILFYISDGSLPFLFAKKNFLHIQVPFLQNDSSFKNVTDQPKVKLINNVICNSQFTAKFQKGTLKKKTLVLYPPVDVDKFTSSDHKENIILSVGRFDNILNAKKQDVLIDAFKELAAKNDVKDWQLIFAGGSLIDPQKNSYLKYLKKKAKKLPIKFLVNPDFEELKDLYSKSRIYWHAAGYEVDENRHPESTEHFGMTIVEAMASGLVPVVIAKGGITEIVEEGENGFLWDNLDELVYKTKKIIDDSDLLERMSKQSIINCRRFSKENFEKKLMTIIED